MGGGALRDRATTAAASRRTRAVAANFKQMGSDSEAESEAADAPAKGGRPKPAGATPSPKKKGLFSRVGSRKKPQAPPPPPSRSVSAASSSYGDGEFNSEELNEDSASELVSERRDSPPLAPLGEDDQRRDRAERGETSVETVSRRHRGCDVDSPRRRL